MDLDLKRSSSPQDGGEAIPFSSDFVERVFREADRKRRSLRRLRALTAGSALAIALVLVLMGRGPLHFGGSRSAPEAATLLALGVLDPVTSEVTRELAAEEDLDADPDSYFVPEAAPDGQADGPSDDGDEPEIAILGQE
jgi:hypothetical protein